MRSFLVGMLFLIWASLAAASPASAQGPRVSTSLGWPDHPLLGHPLGIGVGLDVPIVPRVALRLGFEFSGDDFRSTGSTCVGFIPPGADCAPELREEKARMRTLNAALPVVLASVGEVRLDIVPTFQTTWLTSRQVGAESGRDLEASKRMYGYGIGVEAVWQSFRMPVALFLGGYLGRLRPWEDERLLDGYSPFETDIQVRRIELGLMFRGDT